MQEIVTHEKAKYIKHNDDIVDHCRTFSHTNPFDSFSYICGSPFGRKTSQFNDAPFSPFFTQKTCQLIKVWKVYNIVFSLTAIEVDMLAHSIVKIIQIS